MATAVIMPRQGQSVESCIITEWQKQKGDTVQVGDVLFSYETDKSSFDEKSEVAGVLLEILAEAGDDVPCLDTVCIIGEVGEDISALLPKQAESVKEAEPDSAKETVTEAKLEAEIIAPTVSEADGERLRISPRAKNLALRAGADLSKAEATGPMGRIIERDVNKLLDNGATASREALEKWLAGDKSALEAAPEIVETPVAPVAAVPENVSAVAESNVYTDVKLTNIRKVIAKSMHASLSNMAQLTLNSSFDATELLAFRAKVKDSGEALGMANITINDMVLFATAKTLMQHKDCNAHWLDEFIRVFDDVNLGIAVDTERGLMVPTLAAAQKLSLNELSVKAKSLIKETQSGAISPDKLTGGTFTVTNLGSLGIESFTPVINPPQVCILGVDCVTYRLKEDGSTYPAMGLSLTFDHRALDGAPAARFLKDLCKNLEQFGLLLAK
ncbi:MAG: 2-oxo acid dehydrogenase subunit E2 [Clostridiales bacterium]|nr:2-oxo acid dehydrogenase subunit E2 [Clostridiales bacterium]